MPTRSPPRPAPPTAPPRRTARLPTTRRRAGARGRRQGSREVAAPRFTLLGERQWTLGLVGMTPHRDELLRAGFAGIGEVVLEGAPQRALGGAQRGRGVLGDGLRQRL